MQQDRSPRRRIGAALLVGVAAIAAAVIAGRVILLKFIPGLLPVLGAVAEIGN